MRGGNWDKLNINELMVHSEVIRPEDVERYAESIVKKLKSVRASGKPVLMILINSLQEEQILKEFESKFGRNHGLTQEEISGTIAPVRKALIEKVRNKIDEEFYFSVKELGKKRGRIRNGVQDVRIREIMDKKGQISILKEGNKVEDSMITEVALAIFEKLAPHDNIVKVKKSSKEGNKVLFEKLKIVELRDLIIKGKAGLADCLSIIRDCINGASYLEQNKLVLQDIHLGNLGVMEEEGRKKGVLFDLEGLGEEGAEAETRIAIGQSYVAPECMKGQNALHPQEMAFQFGKCLEEIVSLFEKFADVKGLDPLDRITIKSDLKILAEQAREESPEKRIGLAEMQNRINEVMASIAGNEVSREERLAA